MAEQLYETVMVSQNRVQLRNALAEFLHRSKLKTHEFADNLEVPERALKLILYREPINMRTEDFLGICEVIGAVPEDHVESAWAFIGREWPEYVGAYKPRRFTSPRPEMAITDSRPDYWPSGDH